MKNTLRDEIITLLAIAIRANKNALVTLRGDTPYLWKTVSQMRAQGIVKVNKKDEWTIRLTANGVHELAELNEELCDFYLRYSAGNRPGSTLAHKRAQSKASELIAFMIRAGILVGVEKPQRDNVEQQRLSETDRAFYLMKELRMEKEQKVGRAQVSRATGILLSHGVDALVYNTQNDVMGLNGSAERISSYQVASLRQDVVVPERLRPITRSIIFGYDLDVIQKVMTRQDGSSQSVKERKRKSLTDAVFDRSISGTDILFVPMTEVGRLQLHLMMAFSQEEIIKLAFRESEISEAKEVKGCEACIEGRKCFEMVTMNLTKLANILDAHRNSLGTIAFACMDSQKEVFDELVRNHGVMLRILSDDAFRQTLSNRRMIQCQ